MSQHPSTLEAAVKIAGGLWLVLFWLTVTFVVGVVVWALAGPVEAIVIFALVLVVFVGLPFYAARRGRRG